MSQRGVPVTPAIWIVAWTSMTVGFIQGIMDGVTMAVLAAPAFMKEFFPNEVMQLYRTQHSKLIRPDTLSWCDGSFLQGQLAVFSSIDAIGACAGTVAAAWLSAARGRRASIRAGCFVLVAGMALKASAYHVAQLITGAVLAGLGLGLMFQATLLEDAEVAPATYRGTFTSLLELGYTAGTAVIFGVMEFPDVAAAASAWRLVLTIPLWPAVVLLVLLFFIPETPSSLIQRGFLEEGREALNRIRGPFYTTAELSEETLGIWEAANYPTTSTTEDWGTASWLLRQLRSVFQLRQLPPALVIFTLTVLLWFEDAFWKSPATPAVVEPLFNYSSAMQAQETLLSGIAFAGKLAAVLLVDRLGRRFIFISGTVAGITVQAVMCVMLTAYRQGNISRGVKVAGSVLFCVHVAIRSWVWPAWTASVTEHFSLCSRSMLVALVIAASYATTAMTDALSANLLCTLKGGNLALLMFFDLIVLVVVWKLMPDASRIPIEKVQHVWQQHQVWQRYYSWIAARQHPVGYDVPSNSAGRC